MHVIQIQEEDLNDLRAEFAKAGIAVSVGKEERYFGDSHLVSLLFDAAKLAVPILVAFLSSRKRTKIVVNGIELTLGQPLTEDDKQALRRALNQ